MADTPGHRPYTKTEQLITTDTLPWRDRLDAYAAKHEVSRAEALRTFMHEGLDRADREEVPA